MTAPLIDVVYDGVDEASHRCLLPHIEKAVAQATQTAALQFSEDAELSVVLTDDENIRQLNAQWRELDKPTNVLSFPGADIEPGEPAEIFLGDIVISIDTTAREAELENKDFNNHFTHLIVHGFLHLFGYDHETDAQASQMEGLETEILKQMGIADPYESE